jgi:hypothetical protein
VFSITAFATSDGAGPPGGAVHARRVELDDPVGVGQRAVADAGFERIELGDVDARDQGIEHVLAFGDQAESAADGILRAAVRELVS